MSLNFKDLYYLEIALKFTLEKPYSWESCGYVPEAMYDRKQLIELLDRLKRDIMAVELDLRDDEE